MTKTKIEKLVDNWNHADALLRARLESLKNKMEKECDCKSNVHHTVILISEWDDRYNVVYCMDCGGWMLW